MARGTKRLILGALLLIAAMVTFFITFANLYTGQSLDQQFRAAGQFRIQLDEPGRYYVWDNYLTSFEGEQIRHHSNFPSDIEIYIADNDGLQIPFEVDDDYSVSIGNHGKRTVGQFVLDAPGEIVCRVTGGKGDRILSVAQSNVPSEVWEKLRGFAVAAAAGLAGLFLLLWGFIARLWPRRGSAVNSPESYS